MLRVVPTVPEQRRNDVRLEVPRWPGEVWFMQPTVAFMQRGVMLNISAGGALVALFQSVPVGSVVQCRFRLPNGSLFSLSADVRREEYQRAVQRAAWIGLRFIDVNVGDGDRLVRWIFEEQARQRRIALLKREMAR